MSEEEARRRRKFTAFQLVKENPTSGPKIQLMKKSINDSLNRNERAALAFVLIDKLLKTPS